MFQSAQELLEYLLSGKRLTPAQLDQVIQTFPGEDLHLDYKHGNITSKQSKAETTIREYVCAFANSDGGILIIGVDENAKVVTGTKSPNSLSVDQWASRTVRDIQHFLSPKPRFILLDYEAGKQVLIIAVPRSIGFVSLREQGETVYYLRFHDEKTSNKNLRAPEYLVTDILLGRRERPYLGLTKVQSTSWNHIISEETKLAWWAGTMACIIENQGMSWSHEIRIGCILPSNPNPVPLTRQLLYSIDVVPSINAFYSRVIGISHNHVTIDSIAPFETKVAGAFSFSVPSSFHGYHMSYTLHGAVYVISNNIPPIWYQLTLPVNEQFKTAAKNYPKRSTARGEEPFQALLSVEEVSGGRPVVGIENFQMVGLDPERHPWPPKEA